MTKSARRSRTTSCAYSAAAASISEIVGAVKGVDPDTGHNYDDTRRYIEAVEWVNAEQREKIYSANALRVYPRLGARRHEGDGNERRAAYEELHPNAVPECENHAQVLNGCSDLTGRAPGAAVMSEQSGYQLTDDAAQARERYSVRYFMGPWAPGLVALAALQPGERVLDVACGTGLVARLAAPVVGPTGKITGVDINDGMLAVARSLPPPAGASITWVQGDAVALDFADASFDVVLCQQGLQFFPDKPAALREMYRVLAPAGRVLLSVWKSAGPYNVAVGDALEKYVGVDTATRFRASRVVPDAEALHRLLVDAGFQAVHVQASAMTIRLPALDTFVLGHLSGMPIAGAVAAVSDDQRAALARHVEAALRGYAEGDAVAVPDEVNIATGRKQQ
jgi:ubiquinone/menaquinone biosynthesis C-methylase UbiE